MKLIYCIVLLSVVCASYGKPQYRKNPRDSRTATILRLENNNIGVGNYDFAYQTSDGISREEQAEFKNTGSKNPSYVVKGSYSYIGDDGETYTVNYIADENGYRAVGSHLPKA